LKTVHAPSDKIDHENQLGESLMPKKHHAIYSDPTGAAAAASPVKRRAPRLKRAESPATKTSSMASEVVATEQIVVDRESVARLAYSYWEARGFVGGSPEEDWLRAEREIREGSASAIA
jgi:uncharacterized protein involved in copper resistance